MKKMSLPILAVLGLAFSTAAFGGTVTKVDLKKKQVTIDLGKADGVAKEGEVCFSDESGKKIDCGTVKSVKNKTAIVKIKSKKVLKLISEGTTASVSAEGSSTPAANASPKSKKFMAIRILYLPALLSQAVYNKMSYVAPETGKTSDTLWEPGEKNTRALLSVGLEFDLVAYGVAIGLRPLRKYQEFEIASDYNRDLKAQYVKTFISGSAIGFYLDYNFLNPKGVASGMRIGAGVDVDQSTVTYLADQLEDGKDVSSPIYTISSKLMVISFRIPVGYELNFGPVGLNVGTNLMVPVSGNKATAVNDIADKNSSTYEGDAEKQTIKAQDDLSKSLGHTKNSFAAELVLGAFFVF